MRGVLEITAFEIRTGARQKRREYCSSVFVARPYLRLAIASCW